MPPKKAAAAPATAAASRPRRAAAAPTAATTKAPATKKKAATKPAPKKTAAAPVAGKKRGRPAKAEEDVDDAPEPPKKRGRPSKAASTTTAPKPAGRKPMGKTEAAAADEAPAVPKKETAPPKKRGRPPKGGETTKIEAAEEAAAEQLEEELVEAVEEETDEPARKRTSPVESKKKKGAVSAKKRGKQAVSSAVDDAEGDVDGDVDVEEAQDDDAATGSQRQYWLMKAEQEDREETLNDGSVFNAKFTIDDLREKGGPEPWDGVRNPTACKNMKDMKLGDLAFFYASGGKKGRVPGIVGIMEVVREHEPDLSAFDENSHGWVENAKMRGTAEKPRWYLVHVEFRKKLTKPVTLTELKKYSEKDSVLSHMQELTSARLSVSKVTEKEWDFIVNNLVEGYEDNDDDEGETPLPTPSGPKSNPPGDSPAVVIKTSIEKPDDNEAMEATDSMAPLETLTTSPRPGSRAGSKKPASRAGSRPPSRAASLAPPVRASSRGRSRTPRASSAQPQATSAGMGGVMDVVVEDVEVEEREVVMA